jgi:hypothetical protein
MGVDLAAGPRVSREMLTMLIRTKALDAAPAEALFTSEPSARERHGPAEVTGAIRRAVRAHGGTRGCLARGRRSLWRPSRNRRAPDALGARSRQSDLPIRRFSRSARAARRCRSPWPGPLGRTHRPAGTNIDGSDRPTGRRPSPGDRRGDRRLVRRQATRLRGTDGNAHILNQVEMA